MQNTVLYGRDINTGLLTQLKTQGRILLTSHPALENIIDVSLSTVQNNDIIKYNSTSDKWINSALSTSTSTLNDLTDVSITNLHSNDILRYTGVVWANAEIAMDDLSDANVFGAQINDLLRYNGIEWVCTRQLTVATIDFDDKKVTLGQTSNSTNNSVVINGSSSSITVDQSGLFVAPLRNVVQTSVMGYNTSTKESTYFTHNINNLTDVSIASPNISHALRWDNSNSLWINKRPDYYTVCYRGRLDGTYFTDSEERNILNTTFWSGGVPSTPAAASSGITLSSGLLTLSTTKMYKIDAHITVNAHGVVGATNWTLTLKSDLTYLAIATIRQTVDPDCVALNVTWIGTPPIAQVGVTLASTTSSYTGAADDCQLAVAVVEL